MDQNTQFPIDASFFVRVFALAVICGCSYTTVERRARTNSLLSNRLFGWDWCCWYSRCRNKLLVATKPLWPACVCVCVFLPLTASHSDKWFVSHRQKRKHMICQLVCALLWLPVAVRAQRQYLDYAPGLPWVLSRMLLTFEYDSRMRDRTGYNSNLTILYRGAYQLVMALALHDDTRRSCGYGFDGVILHHYT